MPDPVINGIWYNLCKTGRKSRNIFKIGGSMQGNTTKKPWVKPLLKVLVRSAGEESVLAGCKNAGEGVGGPNSNWVCQNTGNGHGEAFCITPNYS
jgi:hypothetical protein